MTVAKYLIIPGRISTSYGKDSFYVDADMLQFLCNLSDEAVMKAVNLADGMALHERHPELTIIRPRWDSTYDQLS